jgi:hypothetical protein
MGRRRAPTRLGRKPQPIGELSQRCLFLIADGRAAKPHKLPSAEASAAFSAMWCSQVLNPTASFGALLSMSRATSCSAPMDLFFMSPVATPLSRACT